MASPAQIAAPENLPVKRFKMKLLHDEYMVDVSGNDGRYPEGAVLLASSSSCPVQSFRMGRNVYATQFHPELDGDGLALRIETYRHHGYFEPDELDGLLAMARGSTVEHPPRLLSRFVELYGR